MARASLKARFFVAPDGTTIEKARTLLAAERRAIFARDGYRCQYCGRAVDWNRPYLWPTSGNPPGHVDHVFARARGGQNDPSNLKLACEGCNESKGAY
jgi:5-methylcytosine-specific restriction endonuclease McrA